MNRVTRAEDPASTKDKILDAAERLFAEQGFAATSVRGITAAAGVNLAALNYHFGSKDALIEAVFSRRFEPVNAERLRLLEQLYETSGGAQPPLESILEAFLAPPLELMSDPERGGKRLLKLLGRAFSEPSRFFEIKLVRLVQESFVRYLEAFHEVLPELSRDELFWRLHFVVGAMAHTMAHTLEHVTGRDGLVECEAYQSFVPEVGTANVDVDLVLAELVPFAAAGLRASPSGTVEVES